MNTTVDVAAGCQEEVLFVVLMVKVAVYRLLCVCGGACVPPYPNINSHYLTYSTTMMSIYLIPWPRPM